MRAAEPSDFDLVYDVYMDETVNPFMWHDPMDKEKFQTIFNDMMGRNFFWIFQNQDGIDCGMASAVIYGGRGSHIAEIQSLGIKKENQNAGLGKIILTRIIDFLKNQKIERIQLFAESDNQRGIKFYTSLGFHEEGRMKKYLKRGHGHYADEIIYAMTEF